MSPLIKFEFSCLKERRATVEDLLFEHGALSILTQDAASTRTEPLVTDAWDVAKVTAHLGLDADFDSLRLALVMNNVSDIDVQVKDPEAWRAIPTPHRPVVQVGRLRVVSSRCEFTGAAEEVLIQSHLAFGTGSHPTTALCLEWMEHAELRGRNVLDMGCGSGILGIVAKKACASVVVAIDNDLDALDASQSNANANNVDLVVCKEIPAKLTYDVVIANILADPLIELVPSIERVLGDLGTLVLSGVLVKEVASVMAAYPFIEFNHPVEREGWVLVAGKRSR